MRHLLLCMGLAALLCACERTEPSLQEPDFPDKTYRDIGNTCQAADGGLATVLTRTATNQTRGSQAPVRTEVVVVKTDLQGKVQWTKLVWTGTKLGYPKPLIHPLSNGGYIVFLVIPPVSTSSTSPYTDTFAETVLIRLSNTGEVVSQLPVEGMVPHPNFRATQILSLPDNGFVGGNGGFIIGGDFYSVLTGFYGTNSMLMRFDEQGRLQWQQDYKSFRFFESVMTLTRDGGVLVASSPGYKTPDNIDQSFVTKIDPKGRELWHRRYGLIAIHAIRELGNGGIMLYGINTNRPKNMVILTLFEQGDFNQAQVFSTTAPAAVVPLGVFPSAIDNVLVYTVRTGEIEFLTTSPSGVEQNHQLIKVPFFDQKQNRLIRLPMPDGSFIFSGRNLAGSFMVTKTKPDKTLDWHTTIATNN